MKGLFSASIGALALMSIGISTPLSANTEEDVAIKSAYLYGSIVGTGITVCDISNRVNYLRIL